MGHNIQKNLFIPPVPMKDSSKVKKICPTVIKTLTINMEIVPIAILSGSHSIMVTIIQ